MKKSLVIGGLTAFVVIFNLGYVFHEIVAANFFKANFGPGVQREHYNLPFIFLAFVIYIFLMALVFPVFRYYFKNKTSISKVMTGVIVGLLFGFLWDSLQGGIIEYATYNVSLRSMLVDSCYHFFEGGLAGLIIGLFYKDDIEQN